MNFQFYQLKINHKDLFLYLFLLIVFGALVTFSIRDYIYADEVYPLMTSSKSVVNAFKKALTFENQPPFYYIILTLWRNIDNSIFFARLLSIIFWAISAIPLNALFKKLFGSNHQIFTAIFLTNAVVLSYAIELRYMALVLLLAIAVEYLFLITYQSTRIRPLYRFLYIVNSILGVYTQYYFSFLLIANFTILLFQWRKKIVTTYLLDMIWPVLFLGLLLPYLHAQTNQQTGQCPVDISFIFFIDFIYSHIKYLLVNFSPPPFHKYINMIYQPLVIGSLVLAFLLVQWRFFSKSFIKYHYHYLLKFLVLMIFYAIFALLINIPDNLPIRYLPLLIVPFWIIIFKAFNLYLNRIFLYIVSIIIIIISLGYYTYNKIQNPKGQNNYLATNFIMENEKSGENIFIYKPFFALEVERIYDGQNNIIPVPEGVSSKKPATQNNYNITNYNQVDSVLNSNYSQTIWLLIRSTQFVESSLCIETNDEILKKYVSENFEIVLEKNIGRICIQKLRWINKENAQIKD